MGELSASAAYGTAFLAGLLSVFSPCVMPLMPAYLSLISGVSVEEMQDGTGVRQLRRRVLLACAGFVAGFSTVFVALGASATAVGRLLRGFRLDVAGMELGIAQLAGALLVVMGLHLAGVIPIHLLYREGRIQVEPRRRSVLSTFLVGGAFAFGWSPCVGPILGGILTLAGSRDTVGQGVALLATYSAGLAVPFLAAGWSIELFFRAFARVKRYFRVVEVVSGVLLVAVGVLVFADRLTLLNRYFLFLNDVVVSLEQSLL